MYFYFLEDDFLRIVNIITFENNKIHLFTMWRLVKPDASKFIKISSPFPVAIPLPSPEDAVISTSLAV